MITTANIVTVPYEALRPAPWRSTYTFRPEIRLLTQSLRDLGWVAPIIAREGTGEIIDGFARWVAAQNDKKIAKRDEGLCPVAFVACDEVDAMIHHVRLNRARGQMLAYPLSKLVTLAIGSGKYSDDTLQSALGMTRDEFEVLQMREILVNKTVKEHTYSKAWVPIEAPPVGTLVDGSTVSEIAPDINFEKPPNADR